MKTTDNIRRIDELGRIVLPKELRRNLNITCDDQLEIFIDKDRILLRKIEPSCSLCGSERDLVHFKGKRICNCCKSEFEVSLAPL